MVRVRPPQPRIASRQLARTKSSPCLLALIAASFDSPFLFVGTLLTAHGPCTVLVARPAAHSRCFPKSEAVQAHEQAPQSNSPSHNHTPARGRHGLRATNNVILEQSGDGNTANLGQTFAGSGGPNRALVTRFGAVFCSEEP